MCERVWEFECWCMVWLWERLLERKPLSGFIYHFPEMPLWPSPHLAYNLGSGAQDPSLPHFILLPFCNVTNENGLTQAKKSVLPWSYQHVKSSFFTSFYALPCAGQRIPYSDLRITDLFCPSGAKRSITSHLQGAPSSQPAIYILKTSWGTKVYLWGMTQATAANGLAVTLGFSLEFLGWAHLEWHGTRETSFLVCSVSELDRGGFVAHL